MRFKKMYDLATKKYYMFFQWMFDKYSWQSTHYIVANDTDANHNLFPAYVGRSEGLGVQKTN